MRGRFLDKCFFLFSLIWEVKLGYFPGPKLQVFKFVWLGNDEASNYEAGSEVDLNRFLTLYKDLKFLMH